MGHRQQKHTSNKHECGVQARPQIAVDNTSPKNSCRRIQTMTQPWRHQCRRRHQGRSHRHHHDNVRSDQGESHCCDAARPRGELNLGQPRRPQRQRRPHQHRKVRFEQEKSIAPRRESSRGRKKTEQPTKAAASAKNGRRSRVDQCSTEEQKKTENRGKPDIDSKKLLIETPKLDALVQVARQAVQNLQARKDGISIKESSTTTPQNKRSGQTSEQPKRHQHPLHTKGKSVYVGKGKASAPPTTSASTLAKIAVAPTSEIAGPLPSTTKEHREILLQNL